MTSVSARWPLVARAALLFVTVFCAAAISIEATRGPLQIAPFWPTNALALVAALRLRLHDGRAQACAAIWGGCFLANLACGTPLVASAWFSTGNAIEVMVAHTVLRWRSEGSGATVPLIFQRLLPAALLAPAAGGLAGILGLAPSSLAGAATLWLSWWLPGVLGLLIITPFGLFVSRRRLAELFQRRRSWLAVVLTLVGVCIAVSAIALAHRLALLSLVIPVTVFAAARFRVVGVALVLGALSVAIAPFIAHPSFSSIDEPALRMILVQMFLVADGLAGLAMAVLLDERDALTRRLNAEKQRAADTAEQRMRLLTNVSHEIRTPLNAIRGCADLLASAGPMTTRQRDLAAAVSEATGQLQQLAAELLDSARFDRDVSIAPTCVEAGAAVNEALKTLRAASPCAQAAKIVVEAQGVVYVDPLRFQQVVTNLVSNAVKYAAAYGPIVVRVRVSDAAAALEVIDRGPGFSMERDEIFEPFAQRHPGSDSVGVGLSIVRQIVEAHGGSVAATSAPFVETRISAIFPNKDLAAPSTSDTIETVNPDEVF